MTTERHYSDEGQTGPGEGEREANQSFTSQSIASL